MEISSRWVPRRETSWGIVIAFVGKEAIGDVIFLDCPNSIFHTSLTTITRPRFGCQSKVSASERATLIDISPIINSSTSSQHALAESPYPVLDVLTPPHQARRRNLQATHSEACFPTFWYDGQMSRVITMCLCAFAQATISSSELPVRPTSLTAEAK